MLLYQRAVGGWPKAVNEIKVDYNKPLSDAEKKAIRADSMRIDATIDNSATIREIRWLVKAFKQTQNTAYILAAEKGVRYFLKAQNANGGWPQYYPDSALYRSQITYNDDAMMNVMNILQDIIEKKNGFDVIDASLVPQVTTAVERGIQCILKTQIIVSGKPTVWCAQYNKKTLQPEMARKFELVSLSGSESVGITRFPHAYKRIHLPRSNRQSWQRLPGLTLLRSAVINTGISLRLINPKEKDRLPQPDPNSTIWARFYEIGTNRPFLVAATVKRNMM